MEIFAKWLLLASVQTAATLSPGPAFAITVRNALAYNRRSGIITAIGLGLGLGAHVLFVLCGIALVIAKSALIFNTIKYAGAAYLIFIGFQALKAKKRTPEKTSEQVANAHTREKSLNDFEALKIGFLTNLLNPKAVVFFTAIFTQFVTPDTSHATMAIYFLTCTLIETLWFATVSTVLTNPAIKIRFMKIVHWVERICGGLLIALGVKLALSKA